MPGDAAEPAPARMHPPLSPLARAAAAAAERGGDGILKRETERARVRVRGRGGGDALSAAETLHHRLPRWEGGKEGRRVGGRVDGGREVLLLPALFLSLCLKSKYNIYDAVTV